MNNNYNIEFKQGGNVLELGGGNNPLCNSKGERVTFNVDSIPGVNVNLVCDVSSMPWNFGDNVYDGVYSSYCWEHIEWRKTLDFLKEIYRVLKPDGRVIIVTANTLEQCKKVVEEGINLGTIELLFGSQEFTPSHLGVHKCGFSPSYAKELFEKAGFKQVNIINHPISKTDMIIEAFKNPVEKNEKKELFEREYFEDGSYGYKEYRDFCTHYTTSRILLNSVPPIKSMLSVGCGRGYLARILENEGVKVMGMDISHHCEMTRVIEDFIRWDATKTPWPGHVLIETSENKVQSKIDMSDKEYDLTLSINFLEHIPEEKLDDVLREFDRVSSRGMHGIHMSDTPFPEQDEDHDTTHLIDKPKSWWVERFKTVVPNYNVVVEHPRMLEYEHPEHQPPVSVSPGSISKDEKIMSMDGLLKVNLGSFKDCFYYGWQNIDIIPLHDFARTQSYHFIEHDVRNGLPMYQDNTVDLMMSSHLLEHLTRSDGKKLLEECYRVMKTGAIIRLAIPDTEIITQKYLDGTISDYRYVNTGVEKCEDDCDAYYNLLLAGHETIYDAPALINLLEKTGFKNIVNISPFKSRSDIIQKQTYPTHHNLSIILEAEK